MNFWEARQVALEGKKVKRLLGKDEFSNPYTAGDFLTRDMSPREVNAKWELVEEPTLVVQFVNIYPKNMLPWVTHSSIDSANAGASRDRLACLEIIVDEKGKLISIKNV